eukprot:1279338-Amphidinium_carterae.1
MNVVSDCKGVVKALQAIQRGHRQPKGRHRDLEVRARNAIFQACQLHWITKPNRPLKMAVSPWRTSNGAAAHAPHEPSADYLLGGCC